jgi:integrase
MGKIGVPYLVIYENKDGSKRFYFAPRQDDRQKGWATVRLHDKQERPIRDPLKAAEACKAVAAIYTAWRRGEPGMGPHLIDTLGRVVTQGTALPARRANASVEQRVYRAGQIGLMVADYQAHDVFKSLSPKTRLEYRTYLAKFVEKFGETYWRKLAPGPLRSWLQEHGGANGWAGMHSMYRTIRAFFGKVRLCYDSVDHPGFVPIEANPAAELDLGLPKPNLILWPRDAIDAFVRLADRSGHASIGDAIVMMGWLGVRKQDWLFWPADVFERELLAFRQEKTSNPLVLPWRIVPVLVDRVSAALKRRATASIESTTFFHDSSGRPWKDADAFRDAFNALRDVLAKDRPSFPTRYYVGLDPADPLSLPTAKLTMRTMRHTCITLNHDAGVPRDLIRAITGHEVDTIDEVLKCYAATTAEQAATALNIRMAYESKDVSA